MVGPCIVAEEYWHFQARLKMKDMCGVLVIPLRGIQASHDSVISTTHPRRFIPWTLIRRAETCMPTRVEHMALDRTVGGPRTASQWFNELHKRDLAVLVDPMSPNRLALGQERIAPIGRSRDRRYSYPPQANHIGGAFAIDIAGIRDSLQSIDLNLAGVSSRSNRALGAGKPPIHFTFAS
ncbi:hypothetical protein HBH42_085200 [Parastagonospora nodorum]|nr:hypothetical protein HBH42_085200 [Parastagonospora nodorum]